MHAQRGQPVIAFRVEQRLDFAGGNAKLAEKQYFLQSVDLRAAVYTVAVFAALGHKQANFVVIAQGAGAHTGKLGKLAYGILLCDFNHSPA